MLLCRHLLRTVHIPKFAPSNFAARRFLVDTVDLSSHAKNARNPVIHFSQLLPSQATASQDASTKGTAEFPVRLALERVLRPFSGLSTPNATGSTEELHAGVPEEWDPVQAYEALRVHDRTLVADLPVSVYTRIAKQASKYRSQLPLDNLSTDIVEIYRGSVHKRVQIIQSILILTVDQPHLRLDRVLSLLSNLKLSSSLSLLEEKVVVRVTMAVVRSSPTDPIDKPLLDILAPLLLTTLRDNAVPAGSHSVSHRPPMIVRASFAVTRKLLEIRQDKQALNMFQALINSNNIPPEALLEANSLPTKFTFIICSTLVRSYLHWNWREEAASLLMGMVESTEPLDDALFSLTVNTIYSLLETPSSRDIASSGALVYALRKWNNHTIPHGLIRLYYESARQLDQGQEAERLYSYTQSPSVLEREQYPPPQGRALTWLMQYLTLKSRNMHLARALSKQIVEGFEPIPLQDRARFIALTAVHGYGTQARALWERYSVGKDKNFVVANAATLVRVVSLFAKLISQTHSKLQTLKIEPSDSAETIKDLSYDVEQDRLKDLAKFVDRVVSEFRKSKEPLVHASHFDLNSLARAYFIVGQVAAGFNTFKVLMDRQEIPDLHDVNVAMSAMAEHDPRGAARMIERMIEKNLQPDPVTFGTVLHNAIIRGDMSLVRALIRRMRGLDQQLSLKSVSALIRASLHVQNESKVFIRLNLDRAFSIVRSLLDSNIVCQPNTGKYCIFASLRADDPVMAYKFWKLLVKDKTEWGDREQIFQRRLIASKIRKHSEAGWLNPERGTIMLSQLREEGGFRTRGKWTT